MKNSKQHIQCLVVDDEISSQNVLKHFIEATESITLVHSCDNAEKAFDYLNDKNEIDLMFLDINMPGKSGIEFYQSLANPPSVIFTTAYSQYAVDGFNLDAIDYLLKPFSYKRFLEAIEKFKARKTVQNTDEDDFIMVKENKAWHKIYFENLIYLEAQGDYVKLVLDENSILTHSTFNGFISSLPSNFMKVHKSFCVNLSYLSSISGNQIIIDKFKIPIGQTYKQAILDALKLD